MSLSQHIFHFTILGALWGALVLSKSLEVTEKNEDKKEAKFSFMNYKLVDVIPKDQNQLKDLRTLESINVVGVDFWAEPAQVDQTISLSVEPEVYKTLENFLDQRNIQHNTKVTNLQELIDDEMKSILKEDLDDFGYRDPSLSYYDAKSYNRLNQITTHLREIQKQDDSQSMSISSIGTTFEGRPIEMVTLSRSEDSAKTDKPIIWMDCGIHSREWVSPSFCIFTIKELLAEGEAGLLRKFDFFIVPVANPDGYVYSWDVNRMWRKNRRTPAAMMLRSGDDQVSVEIQKTRRSLEVIDYNLDEELGIEGGFLSTEAETKFTKDNISLKQFWPGSVFPGFPQAPQSGGFPSWGGSGNQWSQSVQSNPKCTGVDPNRNFDIAWAKVGSSNSICQDTFHGPKAFSEAETVAIRDIILNTQTSGREFASFLSVHAYSQFWMSPYGFKKIRSSDYFDQSRVMKKAVEALRQVYGTSFQHGPINEVIYLASGSSVDWAYEKAGINYSYALELRDQGKYGFLLPVDQIEPTNTETYAGLKAMGWEIAKEYS
ncbi:hypothetical protein TCAL_08704 [Tigriopus californicus]|uniref:Zinc carboxypeptidase A 1 n=2 Tax=Tigriopus californicus TaxID=6832 RepID=A0A553NC03_TIGCA|nr:hypothetical protein TCAL_08704 [Tigriopus californicus]|eukprot:TCALIF_08704-PA protein Name:"Similar to CPA2 Carboxypeptidase A2 (Homo sapiens)" AED:0.07 eAED:0.07 QI:0/-1/0/1/-1/1/1/0/543